MSCESFLFLVSFLTFKAELNSLRLKKLSWLTGFSLRLLHDDGLESASTAMSNGLRFLLNSSVFALFDSLTHLYFLRISIKVS